MSSYIFIYITNPTEEKAKEIAKYLLEKKLIGCANIFPINSLYRWDGKMMDEKEWVCMLKTKEELFESVKKSVEAMHPYKIPCIIKIPIQPNDAFGEWLGNL